MKALRAEIELMKEDTIQIVKDVQDQCIQSLVDLSVSGKLSFHAHFSFYFSMHTVNLPL